MPDPGSADQSAGPEVLWRPTAESIASGRLGRFGGWVTGRRGLRFDPGPGSPPDYDEIWRWSVEHLDKFWADVAGWTNVLPGVPEDRALDLGAVDDAEVVAHYVRPARERTAQS